MLIRLVHEAIEDGEAVRAVRHPSCGAVASFEGNIRCENDGHEVLALEYEVYERLFHAELKRIFAEAKEKWGIHEIALIQRVGRLEVGETGIVLAVSSAHRREALEACAYLIEEFKKRAPVWKREHYPEGSAWVACHHH
ncbi:MAG: molybdenum cofactor biosynthesis protein MoaE [Deltaproteobacteria bacterium]|nr:molybdenum cofactor biosynthesis protein MoaE [Deltaproteobacteria bacterium]